MKNRLFWLFVILICLGIGILLFLGQRDTSKATLVSSNGGDVPATLPQPVIKLPGTGETTTSIRSNPKTFEEYREQLLRTIEFYGKVFDEAGHPVVGANVVYTWSALTEEGEPPRSVLSDDQGFFSISGIRGKALDIRVSKEGYYSVQRSNRIAFEYAEEFNPKFHRPNSGNPVFFYLRKKGTGSELITSQKGMQSVYGVMLPSNGDSIRVDLLARAISATGQIEMRAEKEPKDRQTGRNNWSLRVSVPDGGLIEHDQEFPFEAPESGYKTTMEWSFLKNETNWQANLQKQAFVKFGSPPKYGRLRIETSAFGSAVFLDYAVNPTGSRNLEHDPVVRPKQTVFE